MGHVDPVSTVANMATGGLYGAVKSGYDASRGADNIVHAIRAALNQGGIWGSSTYNIPGVGPQIAEAGNLAGLGAGLGGALGSPLIGAGAGQLAGQVVNQYAPIGGALPTAGAYPQGSAGGAVGGYSGPTGPGGLTPQQIASLSAMNSQAHRGLAPSFEAKMRGQSPGPGIAGAFGQFNQP